MICWNVPGSRGTNFKTGNPNREGNFVKQLNLLIKPASSLCNMRCHYCFYADEAAKRAESNLGVMSEETAEQLIRLAFAAVSGNECVNFSFQGGEPTLTGLDFFRSFVRAAKKLRPQGVNVQFTIQTNGFRIDSDWADFFAANRFLVGVSLDGDKDLHNTFRVDASGSGTYPRVLKSLQLLTARNVDVNLLCVVTNLCARHPQRVYRALKKTGVRFLQFIPCLDPLEQPRGTAKFSLTPEDYGAFLCALFDEWYRDWEQGTYVSVRTFDDYVHLAMGRPCGTCATSGRCGTYLVVEGDGSLFPCDFYCVDQWKLGNLHDLESLDEVLGSQKEQCFLNESKEKPVECAECPWRSMCWGGCKRDWYTDGAGAACNYYCAAYRRFFAWAMPRLERIARAELARSRQLRR